MTSPTGRPGPGGGRDARAIARRAGFTLIELILVMALLLIALGMTAPTLQRFFRGQALDGEARRLLALTRFGQSRAISEGLPMVLWLDPVEGSYGLKAAAGYLEEDQRALTFQIDDRLELEVAELRTAGRAGLPMAAGSRAGEEPVRLAGNTWKTLTGLPMIRWQPDGFLSENSPEYVELREGEEDAVWLVQTTNRLAYELRTDAPLPNRRW